MPPDINARRTLKKVVEFEREIAHALELALDEGSAFDVAAAFSKLHSMWHEVICDSFPQTLVLMAHFENPGINEEEWNRRAEDAMERFNEAYADSFDKLDQYIASRVMALGLDINPN